ncbi:hypothetical protein PIB30_070377 [Stylosanthes scabra]|uniref:Uncharacterized protein n=1 Tax=Stylosanthes scabra TaxID=79078 RepID=A0ABU6VLU4_9FABA|nr:hypothetical protein [Stylosanthes scabra]
MKSQQQLRYTCIRARWSRVQQANQEGRIIIPQDRGVESQGKTQNFSTSNTPENGNQIHEHSTTLKTHQQSSTKTTTQQGQTTTNLFQDQENNPNKDNPKMEKTKNKEGKKLKQCTAIDPYVVEFLDEDEEMQDATPEQNKQQMCEEELAQKISVNLQIK